jgi:hypothetical protein
MATRGLHRARVLVVLGLVGCACRLDGGAPLDADTSASTTASASTSTATTGSPPPPQSTGSTTLTGGQTDSTAASGNSTGDVPDGPPTCPGARSELDLPDDTPDPQVRVLYVLPSDGTDEALDTSGTLCNSVLAWSQWLAQQTEGRTLRFDTAGNVLDIGFVRLPLSDAVMHGTSAIADIDTGLAYVRDRIERELRLLDMIDLHKLYAVYYGGTSEYACGGGAYPPLLVGQVGAMYLGGQIPGFDACTEAPWGQPDLVPRYIEYGMLHELVHTLGVLDAGAPHQHSFGHAFDDAERSPERDLMYSARPRMGDPPWGVYAPGGLVLDLGHDDYFEQPDPDLVDLSRSVFLEPMPADPVFPPGW